MKKVLILVEGQTEETFVKQVLSPYLNRFDIFIIPTIIVTKRVKIGADFKGGVPEYPKEMGSDLTIDFSPFSSHFFNHF